MTTVPAARPCHKPRPKPVPTASLALSPFAGNPGILDITLGKETTSYRLFPIPSDWGVAFRLAKFLSPERGPEYAGEEAYHVLLDMIEDRHECSCPGFLRWRSCKHMRCLVRLHQAGELPGYQLHPRVPAEATAGEPSPF